MNSSDIIILIIIGIGLYLLYKYEYNKQITLDQPNDTSSKPVQITAKDFNNRRKQNYITGQNGKKYPYKMKYIYDPNEDYDPITINQYHPDYVEVLSVLNKMIKPSIFNPTALPVIMQQDGDKKDVFPIANRFVFELSRKASVSLKLIDIIYVKKQITEDQERVKFDLVIQKETPIPTKIKMLLRVAVIFNTENVVDENNFFEAAWKTKLSRRPILDEVFVLGYSSGYFDIESQAQTEYYAFKDIDDNSFMDESTVNDVVKAVRRKNALETGCLNVAWDEDGRDYYVADIDASNWGMTDRRGVKSNFSKLPKPCSSEESNELYGTIGTRIIDQE
jgi:hypothetical protein